MVGFLLSVVSNIYRMEPTQILHSCCGLGEDCVTVGMEKIERQAMDVCSFADKYDLAKSELDDKRQEVGDLEEEVKELKKTIGKLEGDLRFEKWMAKKARRNSDMKMVPLFGPPHWQDVACQASTVGVDKSIGTVAPVVDRELRDLEVQAAVHLLMSTSGMQTDGQVEVEVTLRPSYASVAM